MGLGPKTLYIPLGTGFPGLVDGLNDPKGLTNVGLWPAWEGYVL